MATVLATINIPARSFLADAAGSFVPAARLPAQASVLRVTLQQNAWPLMGGAGMILSVLLSQDDGVTFNAVTTIDVQDVQQGGVTLRDGTVVPIGTFLTGAPLDGVGNALRRVKIFWGAVKAVGVQGSLDALG